MKQLFFKALPSEEGMRLVLFIKKKTKSLLSNHEIKRALEKGVCKVNKKTESFASIKLRAGDIVELAANWEEGLKKSVVSLETLYEDEYLLIVNKPSGFLCTDIELHKFFPHNYLLVHRLDQDTSGALIVAKSLEIKNKMVELFSSKIVKKTYIAVVDGALEEKKGKISSFLQKTNFKGKVLYKWGKQGLSALTLFETMKAKKDYSVLKCYPITGRTHQIRVHMLQLGHPILGDYQYYQNFKYPFFVKRLMLHSLRVEFVHPINKKKVLAEAPLPEAFRKFWK